MEPWVGQEGILETISRVLEAESCCAVFVVGRTGQGASTMLTALRRATAEKMPALSIHGSPSLARVPYGVLAPFVGGVKGDEVSSRVAILRSMWQQLQDLRADKPHVLITVDDAHAVDDATAAMIVNLVEAGSAKLAATFKPESAFASPLWTLWDHGLAERFDLQPLTREQNLELCTAVLGGPVQAATALHLFNASAGNPMLVKKLIAEARHAGTISVSHGVWQSDPGAMLLSPALTAVVGAELSRLSPAARDALNLVALAEPIVAETVQKITSSPAVMEIVDRDLVRRVGPDQASLRLANPVYGEVLRTLIPATRSVELHQKLVGYLGSTAYDPDSWLRMATWSLDCGATVPDRLLVRAAVMACNLFQNSLAIRLAHAVKDPGLQATAQAVKARAHYNLGDYAQAQRELDAGPGQTDLAQLLLSTLLRTSARLALGHSPQDLRDDARTLRRVAAEAVKDSPTRAGRVLTIAAERAALIDMAAHSVEGNYGPLAELVAAVKRSPLRPLDPGYFLDRAYALAMECEQLCAQGQPLRGWAAGTAAFAMEQAPDNDVFFLPEFIIVRLLACALCAGNWQDAQLLLDQFTVAGVPGALSFDGGSHVALGFMDLRHGRYAKAHDELRAGAELLTGSDPQQLYPLCAAMASYSAAQLGQRETALWFAHEAHRKPNGATYLIAGHARAYAAAALEVLDHDGAGLAELFACADDAASHQAPQIELHALQLMVTLGERSHIQRLGRVAASVEGPWAGALTEYAHALAAADPAQYLRAGEHLRRAGLLHHARDAFAAALAASAPHSELARAAAAAHVECQRELGFAAVEPEHKPLKLTKREQDVVLLARRGLTDRQIAQKLKLSVRTIEGHLYRSYAKLGVSSRADLESLAID